MWAVHVTVNESGEWGQMGRGVKSKRTGLSTRSRRAAGRNTKGSAVGWIKLYLYRVQRGGSKVDLGKRMTVRVTHETRNGAVWLCKPRIELVRMQAIGRALHGERRRVA